MDEPAHNRHGFALDEKRCLTPFFVKSVRTGRKASDWTRLYGDGGVWRWPAWHAGQFLHRSAIARCMDVVDELAHNRRRFALDEKRCLTPSSRTTRPGPRLRSRGNERPRSHGSVADGAPPHRRRADVPVQLAVRARARGRVPPAHREHRHLARGGRGDRADRAMQSRKAGWCRPRNVSRVSAWEFQYWSSHRRVQAPRQNTLLRM